MRDFRRCGPTSLLAALVASAALLAPGASSALADVSVSIAPDQTAPIQDQNVTFTATASGDCGELGGPNYDFTFATDGGLFVNPPTTRPTPSTATFTTSFSMLGGHSASVDVIDMNGGQCMGGADEDTANVDVVAPLTEGPPNASPSGPVTQGDTVAFTAATPSGGSPPYTFDWSFAGAAGPFTDGHGQSIARQFLSVGAQTTYVRVTDSASPAHTTVAQITTQVPNAAPPQGGDIVQSPAGQVDVGAPVTFTVAPNGGVPPYSYAWSFTCREAAGGLHDATGQTITRTFTTPGVYNTCVQITDSAVPPSPGRAGVPYIVAIQTTVVQPSFGGSSNCSAGAQTSVAFQLTHVTGCLTKQSDNTYRATSQIRLNGVPITPANGHAVVLTPPSSGHPGGQIGFDLGQVALGGAVLYQGPISVDLPAGGPGDKKALFTKSVAPVSLFGLKLGGDFTINMGREASGAYYSTFALTVKLPDIFKSSTGGGITGAGSVRVDDDGTVEYNGVNIEAKEAQIGVVGVKDVCFSLIPGNSSDVSSCAVPALPESATGKSSFVSCSANPAAGDHWDATAVIDLPTPKDAELAVFGGGVGSSLTDLGGFGTNLNIPIAEDVFLNTVGAGFCFTSPLTIRGDLGVGLFPVPDRGDTVDINGTLTFVDSSPWSLALDGSVDVFGDNIGSGGVTVYSNGDFDFNAALSLTVANFLKLNGGVKGWVQPSAKLFDIEGNVSVCIATACLGANGVVSSSGAAGCINIAGIEAGAGYLWAGKQLNVLGLSCDVGPYRASKAARAAASGSQTVTVARGSRGVALRIAGANGPPKVLITGPGGTSISSPVDAALARGADYLLIEDPQNGTTNVLLAHPKPGRYTITATDPAGAITGVQTAPVLPSFSGHGKVTRARSGKRSLSLRYVLPSGARLSLVERGRHVNRILVRRVRGGSCPGPRRRVTGGRALCFTTKFTPARGAGGTRRIEASVSRDGIPVTDTTVARFTVPAQRRPAKPSKVQVRRRSGTVTIAWTRSTGAAHYAVSATTSDGRVLSFTPALRCHALRVRGIARTVAIKAVVEGIRYDMARGRSARVTLKARKASAGAKGKISGATCTG